MNNPTERLLRLLPRVARDVSPTAVHHLRTSIRRVEAMRALGKKWRWLRRQAGQVRDLDVQSELLRHLHLASDGGRLQLLEAMEAERAQRAAKLRAGLGPKHRRKLAERLRRDAEAARPAADGVGELAALDRQFPVLHPDNLHAFRKECKRLRYRAEAAGETALAAEFEQIQDAIGAWHDWQELATRAHLALDASGRPRALLAALDNAAAAQEAEALRVTQAARARLWRRKPGLGETKPNTRPPLTASA